ncbi:MAG: hypothetical protein ISS77_08405 [Phycisphaerae bacterium]|nr:hypothetical protein [Phycisphaerae bacterium]
MERLSLVQTCIMFSTWCDKQSERYVARMCGVSKTTVHKYRIKDNWDEKVRGIKKRAAEQAAKDDDGELDKLVNEFLAEMGL